MRGSGKRSKQRVRAQIVVACRKQCAAEGRRMVATRAEREKIEITESLSIGLIDWTSELKLGKEVVKQAMKDYEEKCHDGKEESISFGTEAANKTRMLGTRIGRKDDLKARVQRGNAAWYKTKKWLWRSKLSMRT